MQGNTGGDIKMKVTYTKKQTIQIDIQSAKDEVNRDRRLSKEQKDHLYNILDFVAAGNLFEAYHYFEKNYGDIGNFLQFALTDIHNLLHDYHSEPTGTISFVPYLVK
jgi:hypothetical protein